MGQPADRQSLAAASGHPDEGAIRVEVLGPARPGSDAVAADRTNRHEAGRNRTDWHGKGMEWRRTQVALADRSRIKRRRPVSSVRVWMPNWGHVVPIFAVMGWDTA